MDQNDRKLLKKEGAALRILFDIDKKNYDPDGTRGYRPSCMGIIVRGGRLVMVYSSKNGYYIFPGGGIMHRESLDETLYREINRGTGLEIERASITEYGSVRIIEKGDYEDMFINETFYYFCSVIGEFTEREIEDYESEECFVLKFVTADDAIAANEKYIADSPMDETALEGVTRVLKMLRDENIA